MAKIANKDKDDEILRDNEDDGIDPADLADDLIVDGGDELTKEPEGPEDLEDVEIDENLDLSDVSIDSLDDLEEPEEDLGLDESFGTGYFDDDDDSY